MGRIETEMSDKPKPQSGRDKLAARAVDGAKGNAAVERDEILEYLQPAQKPDELGRLAHYRVLKVLGRGGMGTVFMAEDTKLHRIVALKVMLPAIAKKPIARDRFKREAQAIAAIEHDHIITIYDVQEECEIPYAAMQYLKGMTLEDWLKAGKTLNFPQILRIGKEIAKGLAAAHARQLIHRDIKPSNIWLDATNKGRVKILDFGLARPTKEDTHLTQLGMILGTPAYMSPEQARGMNIDERCDLFSLGCVLYRLCAGKLPFTGKDAMSVLLAITSEEPPPLKALKADLPVGLADLIHGLLAKKPDDRPASAKAVVQTIQEIERDWIASGRTVATRPVTSSPQKPGPDATVGDADPALEESAITEMELQTPAPPGASAPPRHRSWVVAGLGGALVAILSVCCCFGIVSLTDRGSVHLIADDVQAESLLNESGLAVRDHRKRFHRLVLGEQNLPSGIYQVDQAALPKGLKVDPMSFALGRGEVHKINVQSAPPKPAPPPRTLITPENAQKQQEAWAKFLGREVTARNSIGIKMVLIPPGDFTMGSSAKAVKKLLADYAKFERKGVIDRYRQHVEAEAPAHSVRISRPFYLGMTEVTVGQFTSFVAAMNYQTEAQKTKVGGTGPGFGWTTQRGPRYTWRDPGFALSLDHPVCNVTWADAEAFCAWLSKKDSKDTKDSRRYRLPTEAEWEYACRAGTTSAWYFGENPKQARDHMWHMQFAGLKLPVTHKVGMRGSNAFGLFDMHGNVEEMCSDLWSTTYYAKSPAADPLGPTSDSGQGRVARGGSFLDLPPACRSTFRNARNPNQANVQTGFRVVCEVPLGAE
ncbi:MAG: SUMF1/EgtB/PvdO family nonheme iron enzyme [Planctomycetes bacterium]|nr:SUMF1/EgtB/PvdO family nonheme iron enzyme [Planctomycetota bacterium]